MRTSDGFEIRDAEWYVKSFKRTGPTNIIKVPIWAQGKERWREYTMPNIEVAEFVCDMMNRTMRFSSWLKDST